MLSILKKNGFEGPYIIEREIADEATAQRIGRPLQALKTMLK